MVDFIVLALVAALMGYTLYRAYKRKKTGGGCDCSGSSAGNTGSGPACKDYCNCGTEEK